FPRADPGRRSRGDRARRYQRHSRRPRSQSPHRARRHSASAGIDVMDFISWYYTARSWVDNYAYTVKARWLFTLVWALALGAVIWFYGDGLAFGGWRPLENVERRLIVIAVILAIWIGYVLWLVVARRRANAAIIADIGNADDEADDASGGRA